jgi:hypothetical protein
MGLDPAGLEIAEDGPRDARGRREVGLAPSTSMPERAQRAPDELILHAS